MNENKLWEYRVQNFGSAWRSAKPDELSVELNQWGEEGWEVVSSAFSPSSSALTVIAKRPLSEDARRRRARPNYNP